MAAAQTGASQALFVAQARLSSVFARAIKSAETMGNAGRELARDMVHNLLHSGGRSTPTPSAGMAFSGVPTPKQQKNYATPVDYSALHERSGALFESLTARFVEHNAALPADEQAIFRMLQRRRVPGDVVYQQIMRDLRGFRTSRGKPLVLTDIQMEVATLVVNSFLPLIYDEEYDRSPESIRARYAAVVHAIMSMLMPRKFGKTTLLSAIYAVLMMNIPGFVGTNVSVTIDQAHLLLDMLEPMLRYHERAGEFTMKVSGRKILLVDSVGDVRKAEIRASKVRAVCVCVCDSTGPVVFCVCFCFYFYFGGGARVASQTNKNVRRRRRWRNVYCGAMTSSRVGSLVVHAVVE